MLTIGVLALQGDFADHIAAIEKCGATAREVRTSRQLDGIDGLIIPGGESTAVARIAGEDPDHIFDAIKKRIDSGMPVYGTCMGSIVLAKQIDGSSQGRLAVMDIKVRRNAFGPQRNSFETALDITGLPGQPFPAIFIRAPVITSFGSGVQVLASVKEGTVMAKQGHILVTAFHPEITDDLRVHQFFINMIDEANSALAKSSPLSTRPKL